MTYLSRGLSTPPTRFHELDWWDERLLRVALPSSSADGPSVNAEVRLTCTPSQHMSGRSLTDRFHALWASWVVDDHLGSHKKFYFAGDTGYRTVRDGEDEDKAPVCPVFAEVGERFGGFNIAFLPIGCVPKSGMLYGPVRDLTPFGVLAHTLLAPSCLISMPHLRMQCAYSGT